MGSPKTALVTGASSGIGLAVAKAYLSRGYNVVGNGRDLERLRNAAASIGNPPNFVLVAGDIGRKQTADELIDRALASFGRLDILINNAGVFISKPIISFSEEDVNSIIDTNLKGFFYPSQAAAKYMAGVGGGHIIAITAAIAMQPNVKLPCLMSVLVKGGINHAVKALALELASSNVHVNAIAPGIIDTPIHSRGEEMWSFLRTLAPNGKAGIPQDVVDAVLYLSSTDYVTGTILTVDGGSTSGTW